MPDTKVGPCSGQRNSAPRSVHPSQMGLFARVTCSPPLGQLTCPPRVQKTLGSDREDTLRFTVVIEANAELPRQTWEAQIWHNITNSEWTALPLREFQSALVPLMNRNESGDNRFRHVFSEQLALPSDGGCAQFTVRFRASPDVDWQWANQLQHSNDGEIIFPSRKSESDIIPAEELLSTHTARDNFAKYFHDLSPEIDIEPRKSEAPGSALWLLSGEGEPASGRQSGLRSVTLGSPSRMRRYFCLVRIWTPWLGPRHGRKYFSFGEDALLCSFLRDDGINVVLLAISGIDNTQTLIGCNGSGGMVIKSRSDSIGPSKFRVLASAAETFEVAMSAVIYEARKAVRPYAAEEGPERVPTPVSPLGDDVVMVEKDPEAQWLSEWYDGLTYCTWNGLGQDLTEQKILQALNTLDAHNIRISNLIIDDNWQSLDHRSEKQFKRAWTEFEANKAGFPQGLKHAVEQIRRKHPRIAHIAVWHAMFGYWGGMSPEGKLAKDYKMKEVNITIPPAGGPIAHAFEDGKLLTVDADDVQRFFDDFYSFLSNAGIDAVKADAQFILDLLKEPEDRRRFMIAYQDAWAISSLRHFGTKTISCMSQYPEAIFHSQLPTNKPTIPLRNSDDFFPEVPASHAWHIFCNAHNSVLTRHLNVLPDWDMFQTSHPYASFHAAARCVSGGPIYITDKPGDHDISLINAMTAPTTNGSTVILRPTLVGRTIDMYHDYNEGHILRVGTYTGWARTGSGILGLFNISSTRATTLVPLLDFPGIHGDYNGQYLIRAHTSGKVTDPVRPGDEDSTVAVELDQKGWEILTSYPVSRFTLEGAKDCGVAVLGLLGKMTGAAAIVRSDIEVLTNGRLRCEIALKALGTLGVYFSTLSDWDIEDNFMITILGRPIPSKTVWKDGGDNATLLAIDLLAAWNQMRPDPGWSNEVVVQIFVG